MNTLFARWFVVGLLAAVGTAQGDSKQGEAKPAPPAAPAPTPADAAQLAQAGKLLRAHAERCRAVKAVAADYVQRRTTALVKEPLVSKGEFLFVRDPGVVMFFAKEPRQATIRLAAAVYEVYRPQKQQLERFHLDGPELAQGLFAVLGGDAERLLRDFVVVQCAAAEASSDDVVVKLVPQAPALHERLHELIVTLRAKDGELTAVGYRDQTGDLVMIELRAMRLDPEPRASDTIDVPKGTTIVEHRVATKAK